MPFARSLRPSTPAYCDEALSGVRQIACELALVEGSLNDHSGGAISQESAPGLPALPLASDPAHLGKA